MSSRKNRDIESSRSVKRLLDDVLPEPLSKNAKHKGTTVADVDSESQSSSPSQTSSSSSSIKVVSCSSSALKRYEEIKKDQGTSPDPTLAGESLNMVVVTSATPVTTREQGQQSEEDPPLVSASSEFFYSPIYRRYYGLTPPNPRLCNPRLMEDYIDWYINVYMEEELPWRYMDVGKPEERRRRHEEEALEEAKRFDVLYSSSLKQEK